MIKALHSLRSGADDPSRRFFIRARPHIDVPALQLSIETGRDHHDSASETEPIGDLYFTSGRGALKWLLSELRERAERSLIVGLQAFTCEAVVRAVEESGNVIEFHDITLESCSTPLSVLDSTRSDILVLTHLFGIPNPGYIEIAHACRERGIVLIEDLAQAAGSTVASTDLGALADFSIYSFAVDKPVSAYLGGLLRVGPMCDRAEWRRRYAALPQQSETSGVADLSALQLFYFETDPDVYRPGYRFPGLAASAMRRPRTVERQREWIRAVTRLPGYWLAERLSGAGARRRPIDIRRMASVKRRYTASVLRGLPAVARARHEWFLLANAQLAGVAPLLQIPRSCVGAAEAPVRLAVLAPLHTRDSIVRWFIDAGLEAGPFNWPYVAAESHARRTPRTDARQFPQSHEVFRRIINLPLWSDLPWANFAARITSPAPM